VLSLCFACAILTGCASTRLSTAQVPSPTASTPVLVCQTSQLVLVLGRSGVALGHVAVDLRFENHSQQTCLLEGYPSVQLLDANHRPLPTHLQQTPTAYTFNVQPPHPVALAPTGTAYFSLEWSDMSSSGQGCPSYSSFIQVTPALNQPAMLVTSATNACDGNLITSPIEAGMGP
jgi:Protein of unknown function (DUF4232)